MLTQKKNHKHKLPNTIRLCFVIFLFPLSLFYLVKNLQSDTTTYIQLSSDQEALANSQKSTSKATHPKQAPSLQNETTKNEALMFPNSIETNSRNLPQLRKNFTQDIIQKIDEIPFGTEYIEEKQKYIEILANSSDKLQEASEILANDELLQEVFKENFARAKILLIDSLIYAAKTNLNSKPLVNAANTLLQSIRAKNFQVSDATWMDFEELLAAYLSLTFENTEEHEILKALENSEINIQQKELTQHAIFKDIFITALYTSLRKKMPKKQLDRFIEHYSNPS